MTVVVDWTSAYEDPPLPAEPLESCPEEPPHNRLVVLTEDLAPLLLAWVRRTEAEGNARNLSTWQKPSAFNLLAQRSGIDPRHIYRLAYQESASANIDQADKLLMAMDLNIQSIDCYRRSDVYHATQEQAKFIPLIARCNGLYLGGNRKVEFGRLRRALAA